jgi:DNA-binding response OmpR family regulator
MPKRILIVDDEPDFAEMLRYRLRNDRYEFEYAPRGMDALNKLTLARPDAVLLDVLLPDMNGLEVCEILHRRSDRRRVPVILVSGLDNPTTRTAGQEAGARSFVSKPVNFAQLKLLLETVLADSAPVPCHSDDLESVCG